MTQPVPTNPDWSAWAREQLHLGEPGTTTGARQAYLKRLSDEDFLPPAHLPYALAVLEGKATAPGVNEAVGAEVIGRQRRRVEEFARRFFQIPVANRRDQWLQLKADCGGVPALRNRLDLLEPGLTLDPNGLAVADPNVRAMLEEASKIFVLRPFDAAQVRTAYFRREAVQSPDDRDELHWAARNLKKSYPQYEVLAPELIQQAIAWPAKARELSLRRKVLAARPPQSRMATVAGPIAATPAPATAKTKPPYWLIYVVVAVGGALLRAMPGSHWSSPPPTYFHPIEMTNFNLDEPPHRQERWKGDPSNPDAILKSLPPEERQKVEEAVLKSLQGRKPVDPSGNPPP